MDKAHAGGFLKQPKLATPIDGSPNARGEKSGVDLLAWICS
jgi:hypothetical protein